MGNKHCHYTTQNYPSDAWNSYTMDDNAFCSSSDSINRKNNRVFSRTCYNEPSLGALGRNIDRKAGRRASNNYDNPGVFKRLIGTKNPLPRLTDYTPSHSTPASYSTPYSQGPRMIGGTLPRTQSVELRSQIEEAKEDDFFERKCEYCNDTVVSQFYSDHLAVCKRHPQNAPVRCELCGKDISLCNIDEHMLTCEQNVENLKIECEACKEMIPLESHHYHVSTCPCNPRRKRPNNRDSVLGLQECAICLQELKKDNEAVFLACAHQFHSACIESWAKKKKTCPVCMTDFL